MKERKKTKTVKGVGGWGGGVEGGGVIMLDGMPQTNPKDLWE